MPKPQYSKEEIAWSMANQYYNLINEKIKNVNYFLTMKQLDYSFSELRQLFYMVKNEIQTKDEELSKDLNTRIVELAALTNEYNLFLLDDPATMPQHKKIKFTKIKNALNEELYYIHGEILTMLWKLKIIAPRKITDLRAPVHQTY